MIYADNAATTRLDAAAFEAMLPYLQEEFGNASQPYSFSRTTQRALRDARATIAACINASPDEIFFTSGGTESDNWAIKGITCYGDIRATITSQIEHHAVLNACAAVERMGFPVAYLPVDREGIVTPSALEQLISDNTKMVSIMLVNNEIGTIEPISELVETAHNFDTLFHTDAVQAVGHIPVDVQALDVDMLSASGHKFNGPKGVGFLYVKKGTRLSPYADGGAQEFGKRAGTENIASIVAMATALKINCDIMADTEKNLRRLEDIFIYTIDKFGIDYIRNGAKNHIPGNINISIRNISGEMLLHRLDLKGICISTGSACNSIHTEISHVIRAVHVPSEYAEGTIRISFGRYNDEQDALAVAKALVDVLRAR